MIALVLAAMRARRAQVVMVFVLTFLGVCAWVASPWYVLGAVQRAALADIASAPAEQRIVSVTTPIQVPSGVPAALEDFRHRVEQSLRVPDATTAVSVGQPIALFHGGTSETVTLSARGSVCDHLRIQGRCPSAAGEALINEDTANFLHATTGDRLEIKPQIASPLVPVRIVGVYDVVNRNDWYWAGTTIFGLTQFADATVGAEQLVFVPVETFDLAKYQDLKAHYDLAVSEGSFRAVGATRLVDKLTKADYDLTAAGVSVNEHARQLADLINRDRQMINLGVPVGAAQLLVMCWFALYLAGRYTTVERRSDIALLKLRGIGRFAALRVAIGTMLTPMLPAVVLGTVAGYLAAPAFTGRIDDPGQVRLAWLLSAAAVGVAVLGAFGALILAEWRSLRAPVVDLLRRVPARHRSWRVNAVDLGLAAAAVAGAYQLHAQNQPGTAVAGLALLAPGLLALASAVVLARLLSWAATAAAGRALRAGRLPLALSALQATRRPGMDRVFALLAVSVALLGTATMDWGNAASSRVARAGLEVGASRVLTVSAASQTALLSAVRAADPSGRFAMAVVYQGGGLSSPPVLAVDSARLAAVATFGPRYRVGQLATLATRLHPASPDPLLIRQPTMTLDARLGPPVPGAAAPGHLMIVATLADQRTGEQSTAVFGPLRPGTATYRATVPSCATPSGCRLVALAPAAVPPAGKAVPGRAPAAQVGTAAPPVAPVGASVAIGRVGACPATSGTSAGGTSTGGTSTGGADSSGCTEVAGPGVLGDIGRWRSSPGQQGFGLLIGATAGGLTLSVASPPPFILGLPDYRAFVVDAPTPLPVIVAGAVPGTWKAGDAMLSPFAGDSVPVRIAGTADLLPRLGESGLLCDLESAQRLVTQRGSGNVQQVWLAAGAPGGVLDRLRAGGVTVLNEDSMAAEQTWLSRQGTTAALRFQLLTALVGVLLAAAALALAAAVERRPRAAELAALRTQGLSRRAATLVGYGGLLVPVVLAVVTGLALTLLVRLVVGMALPAFVDSWTVLPPITDLRPVVLGWVGLGALATVTVIALVAAARTGLDRR